METGLLNQPLRLPNGSVLRIRLAKAAMSETLGTYDNRPPPGLVKLYRRWAASRLGLIMTGNVMIDRRALGEPGNVAIDPDTPAALPPGRDSLQQVRPINTCLKLVDHLRIMEVLWYTRQFKRITKGREPHPDESRLSAFLNSAVNSGWGTFRRRRLRRAIERLGLAIRNSSLMNAI